MKRLLAVVLVCLFALEPSAFAGLGSDKTAYVGGTENQIKDGAEGDIALVNIGLGHKEEAIAWLQKAILKPDDGWLSLQADPRFAPLRSDPCFQDVLRRTKLSLVSSQINFGFRTSCRLPLVLQRATSGDLGQISSELTQSLFKEIAGLERELLTTGTHHTEKVAQIKNRARVRELASPLTWVAWGRDSGAVAFQF